MIAQGKRDKVRAALGSRSRSNSSPVRATQVHASAARGKRISAVAVAFTDFPVTTVNELFASLVLANFPRCFNGLALRIEFGGQTRIAFTTNAPTFISPNYVLIL
jgi:hypothetical protein